MNIKRCTFTDWGSNSDVTHGFRAYDDQQQTYSNLLSAEEMTAFTDDDETFLHLIIDKYADDVFTDMFDWALHNSGFIVIDDVEYNIETCGDKWKLVVKE